jgi:hypothetical protein
MYYVAVRDDDGWIEASLGGKVTQGEMAVFAEEVLRATAQCAEGYCVFMDTSRAQPLETELHAELTILKDACHAGGARRIAHAVRVEEIVRHIAERLDHVMAGREAYGLDETVLEPPFMPAARPTRAA